MGLRPLIQQSMLYAVYFAPRGQERLLAFGEQISTRHLSYDDRLVGIIGDAGSGKSSLIRGMFPGLELVNNDHGLNGQAISRLRDTLENDFEFTTYHIDMRFQTAFTQMFEIVDFVKNALAKGRRVIVEHFELLYPPLGINADIIIGIGEEIIVTRPTVFGPLPDDIHNIVFDSLKYRKMAHSAEDLTAFTLRNRYGTPPQLLHSDVRGGFVLNFAEHPRFDLDQLEADVLTLISRALPISYHDERTIKIGNDLWPCSGPRIHARNTSDIMGFALIREIKYDFTMNAFALAGVVGGRAHNPSDLNRINRELMP